MLNAGTDAGFTLLEMMATTAILVFLLAVGAPDFQLFLQNMQIRSAAEAMQSGLMLARGEAVRRNASVALWLVDRLAPSCRRSSVGKSWVVSQDDPSGNCLNPPSDQQAPRLIQSGQVNPGSSNVQVAASSQPNPASAVAADCIAFDGLGRVEPSCGARQALSSIRFQSVVAPDTTRTLDLRIGAGGALHLCEPGAAPGSRKAC